MAMEFVHNGIPMPTRRAVVVQKNEGGRSKMEAGGREDAGLPPSSILHPPSSSSSFDKDRAAKVTTDAKHHLLQTLAHPNVASKHWIIRQYDHEVQGGSVIKPLVGLQQRGPSDASVVRPKLSSYRGVALGCGLAPHVADPYDMALAAIDEAIRN